MEEKKPKRKRELARYTPLPEEHKESPIAHALKRTKGQPAIPYTPEEGARICELIATTPKGLEHICKANPDIPCADTLYTWMHLHPDFSEKYLAAKQRQVAAHMEHTYHLSDQLHEEIKQGTMPPEAIASSKLCIELRKWHAARLAPRLYGDKTFQETTNIADENMAKTVTELQAEVDRLKRFEKDY